MTTTLRLNSSAHIPQIGFGTSQAADAASSVAEAVRSGYRHIDTAQMYGNEAGVGQGVRASGVSREEVFVTTKLNNGHHAPADVHRTFDESLDRLGFDYVDLFLIHWPLPFQEIDYVDTWEAMLELQESGRARSVGVSNFQPEHLERIIEASGVAPAVNQIEAHPYFANNELRAFCRDLGTVVAAWSPLGKGAELSDPVITAVAEKHGRTSAQVILRWHLQRGDVVIPKSDNPERIRTNRDLAGFELPAEDLAAIDALDKGEAGRRSPHPNEFGR